MTELFSEKFQIKFTPINVLLILLVVTLLGWLMLSFPLIDVGKNIKESAIAGVSYLVMESVIRLILLRCKKIKSKDDFSQLPKFVVTEYQNVNKSTLRKIFIVPNIFYSLLLIILTFTIQSNYTHLFYWTFVLSFCYLVFNIFRALKIETKN